MAKEKVVRLPTGQEFVFPADMSDTDINNRILDEILGPIPEYTPIERKKPEAGFFGGLGEGLGALPGVPAALSYAISPEAEQRKALAKEATPGYDYQQVSDIEGIGDIGRFLREQAGYAVGFMAAPIAASKAAAMIPAPLPVKLLASSGAFLTTAGAQYLGQTLGRQAQEQEINAIKGEATEAPEITKALLSSGSQAGLDLFGFRIFKPLGQLIGLSGKEASERVGRELIDTAQKEGTEAAARSLLGGAAKGAAIEAAQEPIQQLLERFGAGLDLASDEAIQEYFEAAVAGGLLGAPLGGTSTFIGNLRDGVYDKKFSPDLSAQQFVDAWNKSKNEIYDQAPIYQFADDTGNFVSYTPDVLTRLGINPEVESLNLKERSLDLKNDILGKSTEDRQVAGFLYQLFLKRKQSVDRELRDDADLLTPDRRQELVAEYEQAVAGEKSMFNLLARRSDINSPYNFAVVPSSADPKKFAVVNMVTGAQVSKTDYKTKEDAEKYVDNQRKKESEKVVREVEKESKAAAGKPAETAATEAKKEALKEPDPFAVKKTGVPPTGPTAEQQAYQTRIGDVQKAFGENASRVFEKAKQYREAGLSQMEALNAAEKDVTAELQKSTAKVETPKVGFKTEKGSVYSLDEQGKTSRTKLSEGKGKGTTYEPHSALYVDPKDAQSIMEDMQSGALDQSTSIRHGYIDTTNNKFVTLTDLSKLPAGVEPIVAVVDTKQNKVVGRYKAKTNPEVGLSPIEKLYKKDGTSNTHVGNKIVELFGQRKTTAKKEPPPPPVDPAQKELEKQRAFILQDYGSDAERIFQKAQEYETAGATPLKALSSAKKDIDAELAARLKEMVAKRKAEKEAEEAAKKAKKEKKKAPPPPPPPPPTPTGLTPEQITAEAQGLAEDYGSPGMATAIKTQEDLDAVKDYLAEVERLEGEVVEQKKRNIPTIETQRRVQEMYDRLDAAVEAGDLTPIKPLSTKITPDQLAAIRQQDEMARKTVKGVPSPVENIDLDSLTDAQREAYLADLDKKMPKNKAEVDDIIEQNGNAKESKKIANEVKSDICKGGSDA